MIERCYIGLGSNIGDGIAQLTFACSQFAQHPKITHLTASSAYLSQALTEADAPPQADYTNAVMACDCALSSDELLNLCQSIEQAAGRSAQHGHWQPRRLDCDVLLFGRHTLNTERLQVPHPGLCSREFVVLPLLEINATLSLPDGRSIADCVADLPKRSMHNLGRFYP